MQTTPLREQHLFGRSRRLPADRDQTMDPGYTGIFRDWSSPRTSHRICATTPSSGVARQASSCAWVCATKCRLTALLLVPRVVTSAPSGSRLRAYWLVATPMNICSSPTRSGRPRSRFSRMTASKNWRPCTGRANTWVSVSIGVRSGRLKKIAGLTGITGMPIRTGAPTDGDGREHWAVPRPRSALRPPRAGVPGAPRSVADGLIFLDARHRSVELSDRISAQRGNWALSRFWISRIRLFPVSSVSSSAISPAIIRAARFPDMPDTARSPFAFLFQSKRLRTW